MHRLLNDNLRKTGAYKAFINELSEQEYIFDGIQISDFIYVNSIHKSKEYGKYKIGTSSKKYEELIHTKNVLAAYYETNGEFNSYYIYISNMGNEVYIRTEKTTETGDLIRANKIHINYFTSDDELNKKGESVFSIEKVVGNSEYTFSKRIMHFDKHNNYYKCETWNNEYNYNDYGHYNMVCELLDIVKPTEELKQLRKKYGYED